MGAFTLSSRAIIGTFYKRLEQNPGAWWIDKLSMLFQSDQGSETYKWLGMAPVMRQWIGGRQAKGFRENGLTIENLDFEATIEVMVKELRRDKTGQVMVRIKELADRTNAHWAMLLSELVLGGASKLCYDGQYFFDTDHEEGKSGVQSNKLSVDLSELPVEKHGSIIAPSPEEMEQVILQGVTQLLGFKDDQGQPMNEGANEFIVMLPTTLMTAGNAAITNPILTSGKTNTIITADFSIKPVINPRLTWNDTFAVFRADGNVKPLIRQEEEAVQLKAIAEGSELEFNENKHQYGVDASRNVGFGYWQHACQVKMV